MRPSRCPRRRPASPTGWHDPGATFAAPTAPPEPTAGRHAEAGPTYYLVGSQAQADAIQRGIADSDAILWSLGEAPPPAYVVLVASAEAETSFRLAISEQDTLRGGLGLPSLSVVDLRPRAAVQDGYDATPWAAGAAGDLAVVFDTCQ